MLLMINPSELTSDTLTWDAQRLSLPCQQCPKNSSNCSEIQLWLGVWNTVDVFAFRKKIKIKINMVTASENSLSGVNKFFASIWWCTLTNACWIIKIMLYCNDHSIMSCLHPSFLPHLFLVTYAKMECLAQLLFGSGIWYGGGYTSIWSSMGGSNGCFWMWKFQIQFLSVLYW